MVMPVAALAEEMLAPERGPEAPLGAGPDLPPPVLERAMEPPRAC